MIVHQPKSRKNRRFIIRPYRDLHPFGPCRTSGTSRTMGSASAGGTPAVVLGTCGGVTDGIAYARTGAAADAGRGCLDVPRRPEDRDAVGKGGQAQRNP